MKFKKLKNLKTTIKWEEDIPGGTVDRNPPPMEGTRINSWSGKIPHATEQACAPHNHRASRALEEPQNCCAHALEPVRHKTSHTAMRSLCPQQRAGLGLMEVEKARASSKHPTQTALPPAKFF